MAYGIKKTVGNNDEGITLKKVSISGNICGSYAEITINQVYLNNGNDDIEGFYVFPIPKTAIISGFEAEIGGRTLRTIVEEKEKVSQIYENAKIRGENTFLLEEFKPHIFKISIGKIITGETVKIRLSYIDELEYKDNTLKLSIPAVFEPRRINGSLNITKLKNNVINKVLGKKVEDNIEFEFKTNILVESLCRLEFSSPSHGLNVERQGDTISKITLDSESNYMDKDFILLMKEEEQLEADGLIYEYKEGEVEKGIVFLRMIPKLDCYEEEKDEGFIFLIDISDTMAGDKIEQAKNALQLCIRNLSEGDRFNIIAMGESLKYFYIEDMAEYSAENLKKASIWINSLTVENDADIFEAIKRSLENEFENNTILIFTDDQVEEEEEILSYVKDNIKTNRIFAFGIDSATNNYFLNKLAHASSGKAEFINKGQRIEDVVLKQFKRIQNPQVENIQIDWGNLKVEGTYPRTISYMYNREPFSIFASVLGEVSGEIVIRGKVGNMDYTKTVNLDNFNTEENASLLKKVWARKRIKSIELSMMAERGEKREAMRKKVIKLSKNHGLISPETTFIFMELREEPVLGIELKNIIPMMVKENTLADKISMEEFTNNEKTGFVYKSHEEDTHKGFIETINHNEYLDRMYPREKNLRIIAKNQFADGAFVDYEDSSTEDKIETTAMALIAFTIGEEDIDIYFNQLDKAIRYICNNSMSTDLKFEDKVIKMIILALNKSIEKQVAKEKTIERAQSAVDYLYKLLKEKRNNENIINDLNEKSFTNNVISLFNINEDGNAISEKITIRNENNSIFSLSKLSILKALKNHNF
ncbi:VIT and VWA domain-containing protein [Clostridium sp. DJ247]|uniref:VIT and vWA domain-containing protein n=1 Tax=Clostridium sp. DJ247 TaxID=2726188 RepID=UPI001625A038|nr:VIT and VWA domain-containing protein [Clostridium sp. DJ247]MBC2581189.1 VWA domain-containing protein [Clostridium sp. DJ247]